MEDKYSSEAYREESERKLDFILSKFGSVGSSLISFQVRTSITSLDQGLVLLYDVMRGLGYDLLQVTKQLRLAGTSGDHLVQPPLLKQGHLDQVSKFVSN